MTSVNLTRTYTTNARPTPEVGEQLRAYAKWFSAAVRRTYAKTEHDIRAGIELTQAQRKAWASETFGATSRQAHAILVEADGKRDAILELEKDNLHDLQSRLTKQKGVVARGKKALAAHKKGKKHQIPKLKRLKLKTRIFIAQTKVAKLVAKIKRLKVRRAAGITHLTFGTKKLLRQRNALQVSRDIALQNQDPAEVVATDKLILAWQATWKVARETQIFMVGSKDESAGCSECQAKQDATGVVHLALKMPPSLGGARIGVGALQFKFGRKELAYALGQQALRKLSKEALSTQAKTKATAALLLSPVVSEPEAELAGCQ